MSNVHHLRKSLVSGIRTGIIVFVIIFVLNLWLVDSYRFYDVFVVLMLSFVIAFSFFLTAFTSVFSKSQKHLKHIAIVMVLVTLLIFAFIEYPLVEQRPTPKEPEIKISVGSANPIENIVPPETETTLE